MKREGQFYIKRGKIAHLQGNDWKSIASSKFQCLNIFYNRNKVKMNTMRHIGKNRDHKHKVTDVQRELTII
jgi:hypothetical protein